MVDITRLRPSTTYVFTVRARDADGNLGPPSRQVRATTPAAGAADRRAPTRPGRPRAARRSGAGRPSCPGGRRRTTGAWCRTTSTRAARRSTAWAAEQTAAVVTGLRPGTRYSFTVRARDAADNVSPASPPYGSPPRRAADDGRGTAPTGFRAGTHRADGAYYIDLSWLPPRVGRSDHGVRDPARRPAGDLARLGRHRAARAGPRTASTWAGTPGSRTGCGSGRSCRTAPGAASRRSGR